MTETLGSLCDKLTIVKLKQYHSDDGARKVSLSKQEEQLINEIDVYLDDVITRKIPEEKLIFEANKVYKREGNETTLIQGKMGEVFAKLANVNCTLWHEQEKVYEFEKVRPENKDKVVKNLAILNLERTQCIDKINELLREMIIK
jgi:hypothetical protein